MSGGSSTSEASLLIQTPFTILELFLIFPGNTSNKLKYRFFLSPIAKVPATGIPGGEDLFTPVKTTGEFVGENVTYSIPVQRKITGDPRCIQFYAENGVSSTLIGAAVVIVGVPD